MRTRTLTFTLFLVAFATINLSFGQVSNAHVNTPTTLADGGNVATDTSQVVAIALELPGYGTMLVPSVSESDNFVTWLAPPVQRRRLCFYPFPLYLVGQIPRYGFTDLVYRSDGGGDFVFFWSGIQPRLQMDKSDLFLSDSLAGRATINLPANLATPGRHLLSVGNDSNHSVLLPIPQPLQIKIRLTGTFHGHMVTVENGLISADAGTTVKVEWFAQEDLCVAMEPAALTFASFPEATETSGSMEITAATPGAFAFALTAKAKNGQTAFGFGTVWVF